MQYAFQMLTQCLERYSCTEKQNNKTQDTRNIIIIFDYAALCPRVHLAVSPKPPRHYSVLLGSKVQHIIIYFYIQKLLRYDVGTVDCFTNILFVIIYNTSTYAKFRAPKPCTISLLPIRMYVRLFGGLWSFTSRRIVRRPNR